jgi:septal ring factor EnvC (AmiA/AmiB activator)
MILKILKSYWFWIGLVVLCVVAYTAAKEWSNLSQYKKQAEELKATNDKLKTDAQAKEGQYNSQLNTLSQRTVEISKQLVNLQQKNQDLIQRNTELVKQSMELEKKYAELELKKSKIVIPDSRGDRIRLLNALGY